MSVQRKGRKKPSSSFSSAAASKKATGRAAIVPEFQRLLSSLHPLRHIAPISLSEHELTVAPRSVSAPPTSPLHARPPGRALRTRISCAWGFCGTGQLFLHSRYRISVALKFRYAANMRVPDDRVAVALQSSGGILKVAGTPHRLCSALSRCRFHARLLTAALRSGSLTGLQAPLRRRAGAAVPLRSREIRDDRLVVEQDCVKDFAGCAMPLLTDRRERASRLRGQLHRPLAAAKAIPVPTGSNQVPRRIGPVARRGPTADDDRMRATAQRGTSTSQASRSLSLSPAAPTAPQPPCCFCSAASTSGLPAC